jgi:tellurite resistance protein TerC
VVVEVSDVLFAFDSVPAVIAVSREPLIVYSAMLFAILGLRTLYFVLEALKRYLVHLEKAVIVLLFFIAAKLGLNATDHLFHHGISIDPNTSLIIVLAVLVIGILASVLFPEKEETPAAHPNSVATQGVVLMALTLQKAATCPCRKPTRA